MEMITIANFPAVSRGKYLGRVNRVVEDLPTTFDTTTVTWRDMQVVFDSNSDTAACAVSVKAGIPLPTLTPRLERLLAFGCAGPGEWRLKYSANLREFGGYAAVERLLCDEITTRDPASGITVGIMKIKRKSIKHGHAAVKLDAAGDLLAVIIRHGNAQGLLSLWKSVFWRLDPQYGKPKPAPPSSEGGEPEEDSNEVDEEEESTEAAGGGDVQDDIPTPILPKSQPPERRVKGWKVIDPCVWLGERHNGPYYKQKAEWLSAAGVAVDTGQAISEWLPLEPYRGKCFPSNTAGFFCSVQYGRVLPPRMPAALSPSADPTEGVITINDTVWGTFFPMAKQLSDWLGLGWAGLEDIPPAPKPSEGRKAAPSQPLPSWVGVVNKPLATIEKKRSEYHYTETARWVASKMGIEVDLTKDIHCVFPIEKARGFQLWFGSGRSSTQFGYYRFTLKLSILPVGMPTELSLDKDGYINVQLSDWQEFSQKAKAASDWLGLGWEL